MEPARSTVLLDTDEVRVTSWEFPPQTSTGPHRHAFDYVVVPVSGGRFRITAHDQTTRDMTQDAGVAYTGPAGADHDVTNVGATASFIEIEFKARALPSARG